MISVYRLKPGFQNLLRPAAATLHRLGVSPNTVTLSAVALSAMGGGLTLALGHRPAWLLVMPVVLLVRVALNALDGMIARQYGQATARGEVLNELGDVVADLCLYLPLAAVVGGSWVPVAIFCNLATLSELAGLLGRALGGERRFDGPMGKSDRALLVGAFALAAALVPSVLNLSTPIFLAASALLVVTVANRLRPASPPGGEMTT